METTEKDLITRLEAATILNVGLKEMRRKERALQVIAADRDEEQNPLYERKAIEELARSIRIQRRGGYAPLKPLPPKPVKKPTTTPEAPPFKPLTRPERRERIEGQVSAELLVGFRDGKSPLDLAIELKVAPQVVMTMREEFLALTSGIVVSGEILKKINNLDYVGPPIETAEDLLTILSTYVVDAKCKECEKHERAICKRCVLAALKETQDRTRELLEKEYAARATPEAASSSPEIAAPSASDDANAGQAAE